MAGGLKPRRTGRPPPTNNGGEEATGRGVLRAASTRASLVRTTSSTNGQQLWQHTFALTRPPRFSRRNGRTELARDVGLLEGSPRLASFERYRKEVVALHCGRKSRIRPSWSFTEMASWD